MASENRKSELAGISREEWEREKTAPQRAAEYASFMAATQQEHVIDPGFLPDPRLVAAAEERRLKAQIALRKAFPSNIRLQCGRVAQWLIVIIESGCINGREHFRFGGVVGGYLRDGAWRGGAIEGPNSPKKDALNEFLNSGIQWVDF